MGEAPSRGFLSNLDRWYVYRTLSIRVNVVLRLYSLLSMLLARRGYHSRVSMFMVIYVGQLRTASQPVNCATQARRSLTTVF